MQEIAYCMSPCTPGRHQPLLSFKSASVRCSIVLKDAPDIDATHQIGSMIAKETEATGSEDWQKIAAAKKLEQGRRIPEDWKLKEEVLAAANSITDQRPIAASSGLLSERELLITGDKHDATSLAAAIAAGTYSAEEVVTAFCKRAAIGHQLCNNLTEIMFGDAIEDAKKLDKVFQETGKTVGPLHGLPMTFKVGHDRITQCCHGQGIGC